MQDIFHVMQYAPCGGFSVTRLVIDLTGYDFDEFLYQHA